MVRLWAVRRKQGPGDAARGSEHDKQVPSAMSALPLAPADVWGEDMGVLFNFS